VLSKSAGYGGGTSEIRIREVRDWYQAQKRLDRDDDKSKSNDDDETRVVVATKYLPTLWRWTRWSFFRAVRGSIDRLGVDQIDLYFIHTPIHPLPIEYHVQWACDAVDAGLVKQIGISNCDADLTRRAEAVAVKNGKHVAVNQIMLNLLVWNSAKHQETVQTCHDLNIQIVAYSPIGQGLLTDHLTEEKFNGIRAVKMTGVKFDDLKPLRTRIQELSHKYKCSMAQVAMNWVRGHSAIPLVGVRSTKQIEDAAGCAAFDLTSDEVKNLDEVSLGLSLFDRPLYRRCLFVVFISILQIMYQTDIWYTKIKQLGSGLWTSFSSSLTKAKTSQKDAETSLADSINRSRNKKTS
jgi:aryl-alcohol dehydrogenase-like predicted oxidoreductase